MIQKIKSYLLPLLMLLTFSAQVVVPLTVSACSPGVVSNVAAGASSASGGTVDCTPSTVSNQSIENIARDIVTIFSIVVGAVSVIMIIYGGFRYITSGGDSGRVGNAKNTLIYAVIGLVVVALAQLIVQFVLNKSANISAGQGIGQ